MQCVPRSPSGPDAGDQPTPLSLDALVAGALEPEIGAAVRIEAAFYSDDTAVQYLVRRHTGDGLPGYVICMDGSGHAGATSPPFQFAPVVAHGRYRDVGQVDERLLKPLGRPFALDDCQLELDHSWRVPESVDLEYVRRMASEHGREGASAMFHLPLTVIDQIVDGAHRERIRASPDGR